VAAVVVALLVMVVAVPRLVPTPPTSSSSPIGSASPEPGQTGVLSTAEFAARLAAGDLDGKTVVVAGSIGERPARAGIDCHAPIGDRCLMGQLEGTDPAVDVQSRWLATDERDPSVGGSNIIWPWAHLPTGPMTGSFVLKVDSAGTVEFIGLVRESATGVAWSVGDALGLDVNSMGADETVLVYGWLVETEPPPDVVVMTCDGFDTPPPNLPGLPSSYCQPSDFISDAEPPAGDRVRPDEEWLRVQRNAGQMFGARMQERPSLFAIAPRLYGGGCGPEPPCWQWDVVAHVDPPSDPTPPPSISPTTHQLGCGLATPSVLDETGLVEECTATRYEGDTVDFSVLNPDGNLQTLEISWSGVPTCDGVDRLTLKAHGSEFELEVANLASFPQALCDGVPYETHIVFHLAQPIAATDIDVTFKTNASEPSPSPAPTPSPPAVNSTHACISADTTAPSLLLTDHAGLIESCSTAIVDWPGEPIVVSDASRGVVRVVYSDGCAGASEARFDLWARDNLAWPSQPRYVLNVDLQAPQAPLGCRDAIVGVAVDITFMNAELAPLSLASQIEPFMSADGRGVDSTQGAGETVTFQLEIQVPQSSYVEGQSIDITAALLSDRDVKVNGFVGPFIGVEQLDGDIGFDPGPFTLPCRPSIDLSGGQARVKTSPWWPTQVAPSNEDPKSEFVNSYVRDGQLFVPQGTYRFFAWSDLSLGEGCDGEQLDLLSVSVVVRVEPALAPQPSAIQCGNDGAYVSIEDPRDLILGCTQISPDEVAHMGPGDVTVEYDVNDPTRVRIRWGTSICTRVETLTLLQPDDRVMLMMPGSPPCQLSAGLHLAVELVLSRPMEVKAFRFTTLPGFVSSCPKPPASPAPGPC
jgi:hypothetical protein